MKSKFLPLVLLLAACGSDTPTEKTKDSTQADSTTATDTVVPPILDVEINPALLDKKTAEEKNILVYFFGNTHAVELLSAMETIEKVKTDADLHTCFHYTDSICHVATDLMNDEKKGLVNFYDHIDSINQLYEKIAPLLPYLEFGCEAECSMPVISMNYTAFAKLAKSTGGKQDDDYFDFMQEAYGEGGHASVMSAVWFNMTWDYGGNSRLGAGLHYQTLKRAQEIKPGNGFIKEIEFAENLCLDDAMNWQTLFHTAEKAIEEIKKIMTLDIGRKNKKLLEERIKKLQSPDKNMQLDCEHHDCIYG